MEKGRVFFAAFLVFVLICFSFLSAGELEPGGPPSGTMKTLDEVEPRVAISTTPCVISEPGSYYLTDDMSPMVGGGIKIDCNNVTVDMMGYKMTLGIHMIGVEYTGFLIEGASNIEIRNGTIKGFNGSGIFADSNSSEIRLIGLRVLSNDKHGIYLSGDNNLIRDCLVKDNGQSSEINVNGIKSGAGTTVTDNTVVGNGNSATCSYVYGMVLDKSCLVTGNNVLHNGDSSNSYVQGIYAERGSTIKGNTVNYNGCECNSNTYVYGVKTFTDCSVIDNTVSHNGESADVVRIYGIYVAGNGTISGNTVCRNGYSADAIIEGIYAGSGCVVSDNSSSFNGYYATSIRVYGYFISGGCVVKGNTAYTNGYNCGGDVYGIYLMEGCFVNDNLASKNNTTNGGINMNNPGNCTFGTNHAP